MDAPASFYYSSGRSSTAFSPEEVEKKYKIILPRFYKEDVREALHKLNEIFRDPPQSNFPFEEASLQLKNLRKARGETDSQSLQSVNLIASSLEQLARQRQCLDEISCKEDLLCDIKRSIALAFKVKVLAASVLLSAAAALYLKTQLSFCASILLFVGTYLMNEEKSRLEGENKGSIDLLKSGIDYMLTTFRFITEAISKDASEDSSQLPKCNYLAYWKKPENVKCTV